VVKDRPLIPAIKLNGRDKAAQTVCTAARSGKPGAIKHVGARRFKRLQALYRIVEVGIAAQEVLSSRRQDERDRQFARYLACRSHALLRMVQIEQQLLWVAAVVIEPPTRPTVAARRIVSAAPSGASSKPFSKSAETGRSVAATIARAWSSASCLVTHAVAAAEHARRRTARGRQRLKPEPGQNSRGASVPSVGDYEKSGFSVQRAETIGLFELAECHARYSGETVASKGYG
jgi:hypothetical protein